jgi:hypothetical protein
MKMTGFCLVCDTAGALTGRLGYRQEDFIFIGGYDEDGPPTAGQDVDIRKRLFLHSDKHSCSSRKVQWLKTPEVHGFALPNDFKDTTPAHDRGKSKIVNCDPLILQKFGSDLTKVWENIRSSTWAEYWKPLIDRKVIIRNLTVKSKKAGLGTWWVVTTRKIISRTDTQNSIEAHGRPAAGSADVDMINNAPLAPRVSSGAPQAVVGRDLGMSVEIFIVGAGEIQYKTRTIISTLGRSNSKSVTCVVVFFDSWHS